MNNYKSIDKYLKKKCNFNDNKKNTFFFSFISKILICFILFLVFIICNNHSSSFKKYIYEYVYNDTFMFSTFRKWYSDNLGNILPNNNFSIVDTVFNQQLIYSDDSLFLDGVALNVEDNYLVPNLSNGVVVFLGIKNNYGNCVIIEDESLVNIWYCNLDNISVSIYDYVSSGSFLGEVNSDKLYLVFEKNGEFLDYKEFI